jgi:hypothetical protein
MKRKLDSNDVPVPVTEAQNGVEDGSFASLGLDSRLLQGIAKQNFEKPTPVQAKAIPLALQGKDVLARAKTGTGKTAAYLLPILQLTLKRKQVSHPFTLLRPLTARRPHPHNLPLHSSWSRLESSLSKSTKPSKVLLRFVQKISELSI